MVKNYSPLNGQTKNIEEVDDVAFSKKMMGEGIAIIPSNGVLHSPVQGTIKMLFPTKHAIGLTTIDGVEILIHIGIDTVNMEGDGFKSYVQPGETVNVGDKLLSFDIGKIEKSGYDIDTMLIITNSDTYQQLIFNNTKKVQVGEEIIEIR